MSGKILEYVSNGFSVGFSIVAFGAGIAASMGGDSAAVASYLAVASMVSAVVAQVINRYLVKKGGFQVSVEDTLFGICTGFFVSSAIVEAPVLCIGGAVCVGLSLVVRLLRQLSDYCKKDEHEVVSELQNVLVDKSFEAEKTKRSLLVLLFGLENEISKLENLLLDQVFSLMTVRRQLQNTSFFSCVNELRKAQADVGSEVLDYEDHKELQHIKSLLRLALGGVFVIKLKELEEDFEVFKIAFENLRSMVFKLSFMKDKTEMEKLVLEIRKSACKVLDEYCELQVKIRMFLDYFKDPQLAEAFILDINKARDLVVKLMIDSDVGGRAPNKKLHDSLKIFDRQLVEYLKILKDLFENRVMKLQVNNMFNDSISVCEYLGSLKRLADSIRISDLQQAVTDLKV